MAVDFAHFVSGGEIRASHPLYTRRATWGTDGATANPFSANICFRQVRTCRLRRLWCNGSTSGCGPLGGGSEPPSRPVDCIYTVTY